MLSLACDANSARNIDDPTPTFGPADATATWVAFEPERERMTAEILAKQSESATVVAATQLAMAQDAGSAASPDPTATTTPKFPERAIASAPVNRIAFEDGEGSVFTVDPNGENNVKIAEGSTESGDFKFAFPVWSPDGGTVLFSSFINVNDSASQSALHRANADGTGEIITLAVDPTSQSGIGPGIPHFSTWSSNGDRIALTTSGDFGIGSMLLGSYSGESPKGLAVGAPLYLNWAPDGSSLLVHQDVHLYLIRVKKAESSPPVTVGNGSSAYNSVSWSPDSKSFAHVETIDGAHAIVITQADDLGSHEILAEGDERVAVGWSPTGESIAIARASGEAFHTLSIYDLEDREESIIHEGETRAFWWSPDGSRLAVMDDSSEIELAHKWSVIDVESGEVTPLVTQVASDQFLFVQVFFDQYVDSHNIWSPDSTKIVISGAILDMGAVIKPDGSIVLPDEFDTRIWVIDITGESEPLSVGTGTVASWSPQ